MTAISERPLREYLRVEVLDPETPFVLGASFLDASELGGAGDVPLWSDWADTATGISIQRGGDLDGITPAMSPGLSSVTLYGYTELDPLAPVFVANRQLRIVLQLAGGDHQLFTGRVRDVALAYLQPVAGRQVPVTTITIVDAVADHDQVTRHGALPAGGSETFGQRIRRLSASAAAPIEQPAVTTYHDQASNEILLGRTVLEAALSEHLTIACATVGAMWWVGGDGVTRFAPRRGSNASTPDAVFWFDGYAGDKPAGALHGLSADIAAGSRATYTVGIARNLSAVENGDSWQADETETVYAQPVPANGAAVVLGRSPVTTTINAANPIIHRLPALQGAYGNGSEKITAISWNAQEDLSRIPQLEIGNVLQLWHPVRGMEYAQIIGIRHTITPARWLIQFTLISGAQYDV